MFSAFRLPAFSRSRRKNLLSTDRFFFFDLGMRHAAAGVPLETATALSDPGPLFEQWAGIELWKRLKYLGAGRLHYGTQDSRFATGVEPVFLAPLSPHPFGEQLGALMPDPFIGPMPLEAPDVRWSSGAADRLIEKHEIEPSTVPRNSEVHRFGIVSPPFSVPVGRGVADGLPMVGTTAAPHGVQKQGDLGNRRGDVEGSPMILLTAPLDICPSVIYPVVAAVTAHELTGRMILGEHGKVVGGTRAAICDHAGGGLERPQYFGLPGRPSPMSCSRTDQ